jgi:hypothetical protein
VCQQVETILFIVIKKEIKNFNFLNKFACRKISVYADSMPIQFQQNSLLEVQVTAENYSDADDFT